MAAPKPATMQAMRDGVVPPGKPASVKNMMRMAGKRTKRQPAKRAANDEGDHEYR